MQIRLDRFFLDEKDLFVAVFAVVMIVVGFLNIPVSPFRYPSLMVLLIFMLVTRSLISSLKFNSYLFIVLFGLVFSMVLSPYGLAIYLLIAVLLYTKTNLI
ncbi:hypothetical protein M1523_02025 [Patescibacteria group bacterium]|nr:hypothetical protein [Patescibacteria group bacterium]MCL5091989.1 hypothetical protein [Patescibacteria group bacterium]